MDTSEIKFKYPYQHWWAMELVLEDKVRAKYSFLIIIDEMTLDTCLDDVLRIELIALTQGSESESTEQGITLFIHSYDR